MSSKTRKEHVFCGTNSEHYAAFRMPQNNNWSNVGKGYNRHNRQQGHSSFPASTVRLRPNAAAAVDLMPPPLISTSPSMTPSMTSTTKTAAELQKLAATLNFDKQWTVSYGVDWKTITDIYTIKTVEEFWSIFNNLGMPGSLPIKCEFYMFHSGIKPEWENKENAGGGKWVINLGYDKPAADAAWLHLLLGLVGEQYAEGSSSAINGMSLHLRPGGMRASLWTRQVSAASQQRIGDSVRVIASLMPAMTMEFKWHEESIANGSCFTTAAVMKA
jgi:translation initiation factor 4E